MSKTERAERFRREPKEDPRGNVITFYRAQSEAIEAALWFTDTWHDLAYNSVQDWTEPRLRLKDMLRLMQELDDAEHLVDLGDQGGATLVYWSASALGHCMCGYARAASAKQLRRLLVQRGWSCVITDTSPAQLWDYWPRPVYERCVPRACRKPKPAAPVDVYMCEHNIHDQFAIDIVVDDLDVAVGE